MLHPDFSIGISLASLTSLAVGSGKDANIYVLDGDKMAKFTANQNNVYELISGQRAGGEFAKLSYFNGTVYYGAVGDAPRRRASPPTTLCGRLKTGLQLCCALTMPRILLPNSTTPTKPLTAATNSLAINSSRRWSQNGRVYVGTPNSVAVFGLLP